jgi:iron(III) transport system substrate-binding protein
MKMSTIRWLVTLASLLAMLGAGGAQAQKKLVVYTSNESTLNDLVFGAFKKRDRHRGRAGGGGLGRGDAPPAGREGAAARRHRLGCQPLAAADQPGAVRALCLQEQGCDAAEYRDPGDLWIGNNLHLLVILQNTKLVPADQGPKSWADLLDPRWKGKIAFTDPANSGSAYATTTMLVDLWGGGDAGWKKVGELFKNLKVLNRASLVFQGVGNGEYPLGISLEYAGPMWAAWRRAGEGRLSGRRHDGLDGGRGGHQGRPNPDSAKAFVDYINRKDVREEILKKTFRRPTRSDVDLSKLPGGMPSMSAIKIIKYDEEGWTEKRAKTLERIKDLIQDSR